MKDWIRLTKIAQRQIPSVAPLALAIDLRVDLILRAAHRGAVPIRKVPRLHRTSRKPSGRSFNYGMVGGGGEVIATGAGGGATSSVAGAGATSIDSGLCGLMPTSFIR